MSIFFKIKEKKIKSLKFLIIPLSTVLILAITIQFLIKPISTINAEQKLSNTSSLFLTFMRKDLTSNERIIFDRYPPVVYNNLKPLNQTRGDGERITLERSSAEGNNLDPLIYTGSSHADDIFDQRRPILTIQYDESGNIVNINERKTIEANELLSNVNYLQKRAQFLYFISYLKIAMMPLLDSIDGYINPPVDYFIDKHSTDKIVFKNIRIEKLDREFSIRHGLAKSYSHQTFTISSKQETKYDDFTFYKPILLIEAIFTVNRFNDRVNTAVKIKSLENHSLYHADLRDIRFFLENSHIEFSNAPEW